MSKLAFWQTVRAVLSGFIGIRKRERADEDSKAIHPLGLIVVGIVLLLIFVSSLLVIVKSVL